MAFDANNQVIKIKGSNLKNTLLTIFSIVAVLLFGVGGFMEYNWYPDDRTPIMNAIIVPAILISIVGRLTNIRRIIFFATVICDVTLILCSFRGIAYGELISAIVNSIDLEYPTHFLLLMFGSTIFILDWKDRLWKVKQKTAS
jgi:hypothetical protein